MEYKYKNNIRILCLLNAKFIIYGYTIDRR